MQIASRRFVRPEFLNHHMTMYAGYISEWVTEAAMIGVTQVLGRTDHVVLAAIKDICVVKSVVAGTILELSYNVKKYGTTSVEIEVRGSDMLNKDTYFTGSAVFVTVDDEGKKTPHGLGENYGKGKQPKTKDFAIG